MTKKNLIELFEKTINHDTARDFHMTISEHLIQFGYGFYVNLNMYGVIKVNGRIDFKKFLDGISPLTKLTLEYLANINNADSFKTEINIDELVYMYNAVLVKKQGFEKFIKENANAQAEDTLEILAEFFNVESMARTRTVLVEKNKQ